MSGYSQGQAAPHGRGRAVAPRGYAKGRAKREQIVQAAVGLFGEVGYHAASLRELAGRVGMSHPGLLHHFPTKVALLEAVLERRDEVDRADLEQDRAEGASYVEALVHLVERNATRRPIVEAFTALAAEATSPDHPAHAYFVRRYESTVARAAKELARLGAAGALRDGVDPQVAARQLVAVMDGLQVQWLLSLGSEPAQPVDMAAVLRDFLRLVVHDPPAPTA
ncbi:TetR/AcrR family transcriptional regulator [Cellulosimicrobium marinum]|uniref:TetR/AcrR family transcriptional regulator n=1 Tax=Cellulosimicrobium marinum TaxID=1638992 RepID=UPI001E2E59BB|nr:TetR/AcrR family transcriptional regulator [Cellulosimicrobium marinum]MCB7135111.1 TetR/AcrR family transcriptional regulator [Cellulosimicrobium marinum]